MAGSMLDPDRIHVLVRQVTKHGERFAKLLMASMYPNGYAVGAEPETDRLKEMAQLMLDHDYHLDLASGKIEAPFGDMQRAQQMLFREQELRQEMLNAPSSAASQEVA